MTDKALTVGLTGAARITKQGVYIMFPAREYENYLDPAQSVFLSKVDIDRLHREIHEDDE